MKKITLEELKKEIDIIADYVKRHTHKLENFDVRLQLVESNVRNLRELKEKEKDGQANPINDLQRV